MPLLFRNNFKYVDNTP